MEGCATPPCTLPLSNFRAKTVGPIWNFFDGQICPKDETKNFVWNKSSSHSQGIPSFLSYRCGPILGFDHFGQQLEISSVVRSSLTSRSHSHLVFSAATFMCKNFETCIFYIMKKCSCQTPDSWLKALFITYSLDQQGNDVGKCNFLVIIF